MGTDSVDLVRRGLMNRAVRPMKSSPVATANDFFSDGGGWGGGGRGGSWRSFWPEEALKKVRLSVLGEANGDASLKLWLGLRIGGGERTREERGAMEN